jgi:methionine-rich copper-binding protein CopC
VLATPVKFYSSGMRLRLAFAVAVQLEPDVLLVDEVLAVGDLVFQAKCLAHLRAVTAGGATVVLVTHSPHVARTLCERAVVLAGGRVHFDGPCDGGVAEHHRLLEHGDLPGGAPRATVLERRLLDAEGSPVEDVVSGSWCRVVLTVRFDQAVDSPQAHFTVHDPAGEVVYELYTRVGEAYRHYPAGAEATVEIGFRAALAAGEYVATTRVLGVDGRDVLCQDAHGAAVRVTTDREVEGIIDLDARITVGAP